MRIVPVVVRVTGSVSDVGHLSLVGVSLELGCVIRRVVQYVGSVVAGKRDAVTVLSTRELGCSWLWG